MSSSVIESYLVALRFDVDQQSAMKFMGSLRNVESFVGTSMGGVAADFLKFQFAATGAFVAVGLGALGFIDKLAMSDQQMRLFGMRSFMTLQQARSVQTSLDVLGVSLEDVAWDKELHGRFMTLIDDQKQLSAMLGPQYENQMLQVRDLQFQLQRLEVKGQYFGMKFAGDLLKKLGLGDGNLLNDLERLNTFVVQHMPQWSDELSNKVVPVMHDFWKIMLGIKDVTEDAALEFTNLVGVLSGDKSIQGRTFDFNKFGDALGKVEGFLSKIAEDMLKVERVAIRFAPVLAGITGGGAVGGVTGGVIGTIGGIPGGPIGMLAGGAAGTAFGGTIGSAVGGLGGGVVMLKEEYDRYFPGGTSTSNAASVAHDLAIEVSKKTGIAADLIFGQWAHETGGFKDHKATDINNMAGIRYPGSSEYRKFASPEDFADYYGNLIESSRYTSKGINDAKTPEQFAHALKAGSYYEDSEQNYARGIRAWEPAFARTPSASSAPAPITIGSIPITITNPGATHEQIQEAVRDGVRDGLTQQTQRNMADLSGVYQ